MDKLVSVIIPVYNAEQYIEQAVESVRCQTYPKLEILLVDDGSTDKSGSLCDAFADRDERIRVIHQPNNGLTATWKRGVREAKGEYVGFVDSDDWIDPDMYEKLLFEAQKQEADIVCCGIHHIFEGNTHKPWDDEMKLSKNVYTQEELAKEVYPVLLNDGSFMGRSLQPNRVSKLVKRKLILDNMDLCDNCVSVGEDFQFSLSIITEAKKIAVLPGFLPYYYRVNEKSMTGGYDKAYLDKIIYMKKQMERISEKKGVYDFSQQITNDFLCLVVLHMKGEIVRNKAAGYFENRRNMKRICNDTQVLRALALYRMPKLTAAEKLFLYFMKRHFYLAIYLAVRIYFRDSSV
ncbi:MAG: glycosyltransferase family 2 protein [Clostridiales bacterium]|nr:glycosyltransferase family 2 protein [Clostridiales bacterium]